LVSFLITVLGSGGYLAILGGILLLPSEAGIVRDSFWRLVSLGMAMIGLSALLSLRRMPDYLPECVKLYWAPIYTLFWFFAGVVVFVLSWCCL
jgi:hypothetical protein